MARPKKKGLEYFPLDVHMEDNIKLIEARHGLEGFSILIKIWQKIYSEGYFLRWNEDTQLLFSRDINVDINRVNDVINSCFHYNLFAITLYESSGILTSHGIQARFVQAINRRKKFKMEFEYCLLQDDEIPNNIELVYENQTNKGNNNDHSEGVNVDINSGSEIVSADIAFTESTQSKVKESKVKKSILNYIPETPPEISESPPKKLSNPEIEKFCKDFKKAVEKKHGKKAPKKPNLTKWADEAEKLIRLDGFSLEEIKNALRWALSDSFWSPNILSLGELRKKKNNSELTKFQKVYAAFEQSRSSGRHPPQKTQKSLGDYCDEWLEENKEEVEGWINQGLS